MKNILYKVVHTFYAYTVACALGALVNGAMVLLALTLFTRPESKDLINSYGGDNGLYFLTVTLLLGLVFLPFTIKPKLTREKTPIESLNQTGANNALPG